VSDLTQYDVLSPAEIQAANPGGIPQAVQFPQITGSSLAQGSGGQIVNTGFPGASIVDPTSTNPVGNAAINPTISSAVSGPSAGSLADYFARAIIVILGFIFVAVGLNMLRPGTVPTPRIMR
jgi:hypothetical protein